MSKVTVKIFQDIVYPLGTFDTDGQGTPPLAWDDLIPNDLSICGPICLMI